MSRRFKDFLKSTFSWITFPIRSGPLAGMNWIAWCGKRFLLGTYEPEKTDAVVNGVHNGQVTFDIGGHVGYYALIQSRMVGEKGKVFVFEPRPLNISYIKRHIRINRVKNVTLVESAVSDSIGTQRFESRTGTGTGHLSDDGNLSVETKVVDHLVEDENYPVPDFIKIDVEGGEIGVINGARKTIEKHKPNLLVATHGNTEHEFVLNFLDSQGYHYEILNPSATKGDTEIMAWPQKNAA